ncbi:tetratricopeptide repeat protein, partial [Streptomyces albus]|uniref:tetratricopeptide repeat protein n=5 Tax=Streptomyces TaxID=1883 RepID=UPI001F0A3509
AAALLNLGDLDARNDRFEQALVRYRTALDAAREGGDEQAAGRAMESLGACYAELEEWERAADWYGRALEARLAQDRRADQEAAARLHGRIGTVHACAGSWEEA